MMSLASLECLIWKTSRLQSAGWPSAQLTPMGYISDYVDVERVRILNLWIHRRKYFLCLHRRTVEFVQHSYSERMVDAKNHVRAMLATFSGWNLLYFLNRQQNKTISITKIWCLRRFVLGAHSSSIKLNLASLSKRPENDRFCVPPLASFSSSTATPNEDIDILAVNWFSMTETNFAFSMVQLTNTWTKLRRLTLRRRSNFYKFEFLILGKYFFAVFITFWSHDTHILQTADYAVICPFYVCSTVAC